MSAKTLVRIPYGMHLSELLLFNLETLFGGKCCVELYQAIPNTQDAYKSRVVSLQRAFLFILEAIPPSPISSLQNPNEYLDKCLQQGDMPGNLPIKIYKERFAKYISLLLKGLMQHWSVSWQDAITWLQKAEQYVCLLNGAYNIATLIRHEVGGTGRLILQWEKQLPSCGFETIKDLEAIKNGSTDNVFWFQYMDTYEKKFLTTSLLKTPNISQTFSFIPRYLQSIPATNFSESQMIILTEEGAIIDCFEGNFRANYLVPQVLANQTDALKSFYCSRNLKQMHKQVKAKKEGAPIVLHTAHITDFFSYNPVKDQVPEGDAHRLIEHSIEALKEKHPEMALYLINHLIHCDATHFKKTKANDHACQLFLKALDTLPEMPELDELKAEYQVELTSDFGLDTDARELRLLAYEHRLVGLVHGSVLFADGGDTGFFALMHVYAEWLDEHLCKERFPLEEKKESRDNYHALLMHLYASGHYQAIAALSAPGALGLKHAVLYWPEDTLDAIGASHPWGIEAFINNNILAYNHDLNVCLSATTQPLRCTFANCLMVASRLTETNRSQLLAELRVLLENEDLWNAKKQYSPDFWALPKPWVIERVKDILNSKEAEIDCLAKVFHIVLLYSEQSYHSMPGSQTLYTSLKRLYESENPNNLEASTYSNTLILQEFSELLEKTKSMECIL